jgi:hypothetical protein
MIKSIVLTILLSINTVWEPLPSGLVVIKVQDKWIAHSARLVLCDTKPRRNLMLVADADGACYLVDPDPIGYYKEDPTDPKHFNIKFYPLIERTWNHGKNLPSNR